MRREREAARKLAAIHAEAKADRDAYAAMLDSIIDNSQSRSPGTAPEPPDIDAGGDGSPLDLAVLRELGRDLDDSDGDLRSEIIDSYLADAETSIPALVEAGATDDEATVMAIAHRLKSTSALVGAGTLAGLLTELEQAVRDRRENYQELLKPVAAEYAQVELWLGRLRDDGAELIT